MNNIIKEKTFEYNNLLIAFVKEFIKNVKDNYNLEDEDVQYLLGLDEKNYNKLLKEDFDGNISSGLISTLYVITGGRLSLQQIGKNIELDNKEIDEQLNKIIENKRQRKIDLLLKKLGIENDNDLDCMLDVFDDINKIIDDKSDLLTWLKGK